MGIFEFIDEYKRLRLNLFSFHHNVTFDVNVAYVKRGENSLQFCITNVDSVLFEQRESGVFVEVDSRVFKASGLADVIPVMNPESLVVYRMEGQFIVELLKPIEVKPDSFRRGYTHAAWTHRR